LDFKISVKN